MNAMILLRRWLFVLFIFLSFSSVQAKQANNWAQYQDNPFVIRMDIPAPSKGKGGIIVADLNGDDLMDYLVTVPGHIAAYANSGQKLWILKVDVRVSAGSSERFGLPGHHAPGIQVADVDGDGVMEVLFLKQDSTVNIVAGSTGKEKQAVKIPVPKGAQRWEHLVVANFRGKGDKDILLQATNAKYYRMGRYLAAYSIDNLRKASFKLLWERDDFVSCAHNGARVADLDGDGRDEVLGGTIISPDGRILCKIPLTGHIDSIYAADVRPDIPGLEVVALEEGNMNEKDHDRIFLYNTKGLIWQTHHRHQEPQNGAVGEFDTSRPGLEVWCRSRHDKHQRPFVFDAQGKLIGDYKMDDVAPKGWTVRGVEVINTIDWTGHPKQLAAAKARKQIGDVAIFDPIDGKFLHHFKEKTDRIYVADVSGDWREELIVVAGNQLHIYHNDKTNPNPDHPRLWRQNRYRRSKMTWNYYSP